MEYQSEIANKVRTNETNFTSGGTTSISKYVSFDLYETINKVDAYINSKHISGEYDELQREKPFFNICTSAINTWFRATDLDRRNIIIKPTKETDVFSAYVANIHLQNWMRRENFGKFLNTWGITLARYGSSVVKFIEGEDKLHAMVIPWNRLIVDTISFDNDVVIEVLELTPAQLRARKGYDQEMVTSLLEATSSRETLDGQDKDTKTDFIKVYEVHGELPLAEITLDEKDKDTYVQQMHVLSFVAKKGKGEYDDFCLYKGREDKNPYMITHLIEEDGRTMAIGAVEHLFEAQWMVNHTKKQIKDQLDLASKLIFQTADSSFIGQNALSSIDTGDILVHEFNKPLTQIQNNSHDITSLQNYGGEWKQIGSEIVGVSESMLGNTAPSGTAWRQVEALLQENHSLFEIMVENKGFYVEQMMREYIIPYIKTLMDSSEEISATLDTYGIEEIETRYVQNKAIRDMKEIIKDAILNQKPMPEMNMEEKMQEIQAALATNGKLRFIKPSDIKSKKWKDVLKNFEWEVECDITGEQRNTRDDMATLATVWQTLVGLQGREMTPDERLVFNKLITNTGTLSPMEISQKKTQIASSPSGGQQVGAGLSKLADTQQTNETK